MAAPVSVVIPTRNRPHMVCAAVRSALAQSVPPDEVIVVIDGPEDASENTAAALRGIVDPKLRVLALDAPVGGAEARNLGVRAAVGEWIAFLDDDDLWMPDKLERQLQAAAQASPDYEPVLGCRVLARAPGWQEVWPRHLYRAGQPMAEYLFCRKGFRYGDALLQTSTLLARQSLLLRVPFTTGLSRHQDWDWLLRVAGEPGVTVRCLAGEPLVFFHVEGERASVSRKRDWRWSAKWALSRTSYFSRRAMRGFLATECAAQAQGSPWIERAELFGKILRLGPFAAQDLTQAALLLLVPQDLRRRLRDAVRDIVGASAFVNGLRRGPAGGCAHSCAAPKRPFIVGRT